MEFIAVSPIIHTLMKVSVIIPTYNRCELLLETLQALKNQNASFPFEIIVACDACTDGTLEMLAYQQPFIPSLSFLDLPKGGPAKARNAAAQIAKGDILAFTDDDCIPSRNWVETIASNMGQDWVGLQGRTETYNQLVTPLTHQIENLTGHSAVPTCNAAYKRTHFWAAGGFDERFPFPHNEDADFAWKMEERGTISFCPDMLVIHPPRKTSFKQVASRMKILESEFLLFYKNPAAYRRHRQSSPWLTIYWEVFVVHQLYSLKGHLRHIFRPRLFFTGVCLRLVHWASLFLLFPTFWRASEKSSKIC